MSTFFQGQMDYIFFFYGLAFIGLGVVSYILSQEVNQRLPWGWLALFGLTHGFNEWLDLLAMSWGDGVWFAACRWAVMTVSFLCLVEFGRLGLIQRRGRGPGRWLLIVLALGAGLGALDGWSGLNATSRYALGLVGSLWAGWVLYVEGKSADPRGRPWLLAGAIGFILYGLATGLIVPRAGFFPAAAVNYETFSNLTGLPIQLVRGLLAVWIAAMTAGYFQVSWPATYEHCHRYRARYLYGVGAALAAIMVAGWLLTQFLGNLAWQQVRKDSLADNQFAIQRLAFEVQEAEEVVKAICGSPWIAPALESRSPQTLAQANSVLDRYKQSFGASVAYLLDTSGTTIASSNRGDPDSFVGQNYAFRPYFQKAMAGKVGCYLALGVTSKKRGFYAAHPVQAPTGKILGVAVYKVSLNRFQQDLRGYDPAFLIDPQGIVFVASRSDLDYQSLWPVVVTDPGDFKAQYGIDRFTPIFSQPLVDGARVEFAGKGYVVTRQNLDAVIAPGWALVNLEPFNPIVHYRFMGITTAFFLVFLTLVSAGTNLSIREGANRILASEARFRAIFAAAPEAVFVYDPETRRILDANPFMAQWLGYGPEELVGLDIDQVRSSDSLGPQEECAWEGSDGLPLSSDLRYRKRDGALVDVECTAAKILHGDQIRELVFVRDITERKRAENEVRQAKEYLENIIENSADPIGIVDQRGRIIQWNKAAEQAFGYSFGEIEGKSSFELYADNNELQGILAQLRRDGSVRGYEIHLKKKDGGIALFALSISLLYDRNHKAIGSMCVARDLSEIKKALDDLATVNQQLQHEVTERKQMEIALQETNRSLQEMVAQVEERNRTMSLSNEMADMLQACQVSEEAYKTIGLFMPSFFPDDAGALYMLNNSRNLFEAVARWGEVPPAASVIAPDECWSVRRGRLHRAINPQEGLLCRHVTQAIPGGYLCVPLIAQGETLGILHIQLPPPTTEQIAGLGLAKEQLALTVAEDMALALANLRLRESLRSQAIRDPLTGLFNRRYLEETMERELIRVKRLGAPLGVIMMDLDHFKEYNDTFGHTAGDALLSALGNLVRSHIRGEDIACRYGGEEFLVIMPGTTVEIALERAETLRQAVKKMYLLQPGLKPTTLSLGVAVYPNHGDTDRQIINAADVALYRAKQTGRDRVVLAEPAGATDLPTPPRALQEAG
ncbi:MAG: diguanylate cyclase [Desulfobaccales bacterium]